MRFALVIVSLLLAAAPGAQAQDSSTTYSSGTYANHSDRSDVRPFLAWIPDATFTPGVDLEPVIEFGDFDNASVISAAAYAAVRVTDGIEVGGRWGFSTLDPDRGDGNTGIEDLRVYGRYHIPVESDGEFALGAQLTLPIGDEDVGQSNFDFEAFGAMRYAVEDVMTLLAHVGLQSLEFGNDREAGLRLGGGVLLPLTEEVSLVTELDLGTAIDYAAISGGVDFELPTSGHLRAALALGLDDGAPDFELLFGFQIPIY